MNKSQETMTKIEQMDFLVSNENSITPSFIQKLVADIFKIDLLVVSKRDEEYKKEQSNHAPEVSKYEKLSQELDRMNSSISGPSTRKLINEVFGINLDGIASLELARISIYSKGQWVIRNEKDLFIVSTDFGDIEINVTPAPYFIKQQDSSLVPTSVYDLLSQLGYTYNEDKTSLVFKTSNHTAVPDSFKGQTMGALLQVIQSEYADL